VDLCCPTDAVGRAQFQQRVLAALGELNADQRDLLSLYLWEERSYVELSEIYQTKVATLRVRVHRALCALQRQIQLSGALS
ncbi:MAG: sigma-70 family RNA polymerase sigma factor, partial [Xanthomonadales bacterium]|nr:sigma-70 family RNA polymerase sigma factor [Xanthomonadales bacterium]